MIDFVADQTFSISAVTITKGRKGPEVLKLKFEICKFQPTCNWESTGKR